ncbi:MAG: PAS domain S-box protein, partial [Gemmatimonadaceae bacterium]|nr:PAS domain S-box protein [Acetobacteraceae bacterium]
ATGVASLNLFALLHVDLGAVVREALRQAASTGSRVVSENVAIETNGAYARVTIIVEPLPDTAEAGLFLVAFQDATSASTPPNTPAGSDGEAVRNLTLELSSTRERLRHATEALQASNEELQSSNEEYLSINEELQSANEELETSKEELQSLNEELQTINGELNQRNESMVRANSDLSNLFDSTSIATLFLDNALRIRRFTPRLLDIFKIREGDEGRPITDIVTHLADDGLGQDVQQVLRGLVPIEREVEVEDSDISYLMQVRPYRDLNDVINGAVVTFVDISERKRHEQARSRLAAIVDGSQDAIISHGRDGIVTSWNAAATQLFGYPDTEAIGRPMSVLLDSAMPGEWPRLLDRLDAGERIPRFDSARTARDGRTIQVSVTISPVRALGGPIIGASVVARDVSERKAAEEKAALLLGELDHRVKNILAIVSSVVTQTLKSGLPPADFATEVEGRIRAIAKAHSLLTQAGHGEMSLHAIVATELAPYNRADSVTIAGQDVALTPMAGLALAMAVHELASNAAKYGALSTSSGRLSVAWATSGESMPTMTLTWIETEGPAVQPPTRRGFGTTLIERSLTHELDAEVRREFLREGLRCTVTMPLTEEVGRIRVAQ